MEPHSNQSSPEYSPEQSPQHSPELNSPPKALITPLAPIPEEICQPHGHSELN